MFPGFAKLRETLTAAVYLRQISRQLQRANNLAELRLSLEYPGEYKAYKSGRKTPRMTEISIPTVESWNRAWEDAHPVEEADDLEPF